MRPARPAYRPGQPIITASTPPEATGLQGLYWLVQYQSARYWIGPAQGPTREIHQEYARRLAEALRKRAGKNRAVR